MKHMKVAFSHKVQFYFGSLLGRDSVDISVTITILQSFMSLMTISPSLSEQFETLVNLAVVTNIIPYIGK